VNFFRTTWYNTSKYNPLLNIQHDAGRGAASGCGLVALVRKALKARRLATTEYSCASRSGYNTATGCCLYSRATAGQQWLIKHTPSEASEYVSENRYTWLPLLCLTPPTEGSPGTISVKFFRGCERMARLPNAVEIFAENYNRLSRVHERYRQTDRQTDRWQTDGRQHIANVNVSSGLLIKLTLILTVTNPNPTYPTIWWYRTFKSIPRYKDHPDDCNSNGTT